MGGGSCIRAVILCFFFFFFNLVCINGAILQPRGASNLVREPEIHRLPKRALLEMNLVMRRMKIEVNDYPGSGANNRHTPRGQ